MILQRAISINNFLNKKFDLVQLEGAFADSIGEDVQLSGSWLFFGDSGNGKTEMMVQLAIYLSRFSKVAYNTVEEGDRHTFQKAIKRQRFTAKERRSIQILNESFEELMVRLAKPKAPKIVFNDSVQFMMITKIQYKLLISQFPDVLFIWVSHIEGKKPTGSVAQWIRYHADVKGYVEGFKAFITSRYGGNKPYIINEDRAAEYYNEF
jgi:hypothetical protein